MTGLGRLENRCRRLCACEVIGVNGTETVDSSIDDIAKRGDRKLSAHVETFLGRSCKPNPEYLRVLAYVQALWEHFVFRALGI